MATARRILRAWDFVLVFPVDPPDEVDAVRRKFCLKNVISRLTRAGLETKLFLSVQQDEVYCKVRATYARLQAEADRVNYKLELDENATRARALQPTSWRRPLNIVDVKGVSPLRPYQHIYARYDVASHLQPLYKKHPPFGVFSMLDRLKLTMSIMKGPRSSTPPCAGLDIGLMLDHRAIVGAFPLHDHDGLAALRERWSACGTLPWNLPLWNHEVTDSPGIRTYFGQEIALYFAYLAHYTRWLVPVAVAGAFAFLGSILEGGASSWSSAAFGLFVAIWAVLFLQSWKRRQSLLAVVMGQTEFEEREETRPQFRGIPIPSPIDGSLMLWNSRISQLLRRCGSNTAILTSIITVLAAVVGIFVFRVWASHVNPIKVLGWNVGPTLSSLLNSCTIIIFNKIYTRIAQRLNEMENHRTQTEYDSSMAVKTFLFQFVNTQSSLAYIAFVKGRFDLLGYSTECTNGGDCLSELRLHLSLLFISQLIINNTMELTWPLLHRTKQRRRQRAAVVPAAYEPRALASRVSPAEEEYELKTFPGVIPEYTEIIIQYGFVCLFVVAFPLAPLLALVNSMVEIRVDAFKLCKQYRRPFPRGAEDIGTWEDILDFMSSMAVFTNLAVVVFTSELLENESTLTKVLLFVVAEHAVFALRYALSFLPNRSRTVAIQLQRQAIIRRKLVDEQPDDFDEMGDNVHVPVDYTIFDHDVDEAGGEPTDEA